MSDFPTSDSSDRVRRLADEARALPPGERPRFLEAQCQGDQTLLGQVMALLAAEEDRSRYAETMDPSTAQAGAGTIVSATEPTTPRQIGVYKLLEQLGEGGFGVVWLAEQSAPVRRRVALKIIKPGMDSRAIVARFEQERQALAIMDHANIAKVLDAGTAPDGRPYFVMEYVAGEAITSYCDRSTLGVRERLELFIGVCEAVQHAHHKGIIHRDIKPNNVLVTVSSGAPTVKVIDFGVAKALSHTLTDKTIFTEQGQILGTPEYMSPEQAEMGALDIDTRTDVYSLGVLLYELLTGALPFESRDLRSKGYNEIQRIIREVEPPKPSTKLRSLGAKSNDVATRRHMKLEDLEGQLRRELEWIPLKAMRKDRSDRYATPLAMADDIRNHLAGRPLVAGPVSVMYRAKKFVSRNRLPVAAAAAVLLAIIGGGILSTIGFVKASQQRDRADAEARRATDEASRLRSVNLYVTSMLASANPASGDRKNVTVRELLEGAVAKLDGGALKDQPQNESALRAIIAATYRSLSMFEQAEPQWKKAQELGASSAGANSPEVAMALTGLGQLQTDTARFEDAARSLQQALTIQRAALKPDDYRLGDTIGNLGVLSERRGDLKTAEAQHREALAIYQKNPGDTARIADATANLSGVLFRSGDNKQALAMAQEALALRRKTSGDRSADVWNSLSTIAFIQEAVDDLLSAERTRREALTLARDLVDEKHQMTVASMSNLARTLWLRGGGSLDEAEKLQVEAVQLAKAVHGAQSLQVAVGLNLLACIARDRGQNDQAVDLFREALAVRKAVQPADHVDVAGEMSQLADALSRTGKSPAEAIELAKQALSIRTQALPAGNWKVCVTTSILGGAYAAAGQFDQAEPLLLEGFKGLESGSALGKRPRADAAARLVALYEKWGKMDEAGQWRARRSALSSAANVP